MEAYATDAESVRCQLIAVRGDTKPHLLVHQARLVERDQCAPIGQMEQLDAGPLFERAAGIDDDDRVAPEGGELRRGMRTFSNFAVSFTIISILSGCLTLFGFAMNTGGPAVMTLGWLVVGGFVTLVALGMAEPEMCIPYMRRLAERRSPSVRSKPNRIPKYQRHSFP